MLEGLVSASEITRREILRLALASPLLAAMPSISFAHRAKSQGLSRDSFLKAPSSIVPVSDTSAVKQIKLVRQWKGPLCQSRLVNAGKESVRVKEVVLFDLAPSLPPETQLYGEGFQMLTQTGGTLGQPADLGNYTDAKHYKIPAPAGARAFYGMMMLTPPEAA